jgi:anti-sigma factor RsiW
MKPDDLEFLIAAYADGTLDPTRRADVESALRDDPAARQMLASYQAVDGLMRDTARGTALPPLQWDRLEASLSRQVAALAARPSATVTETEEENLSRLASGELPASERSLVDAKLARDPHARLVLAEYAAIERGFDQLRATPLPAVKWDALADHISAAVRQQADTAAPESYRLPIAAPAAAELSDRRPGVLGRIGFWAAQPRWIAAAACLLIGTTIAVRLATTPGTGVDGVSPVAGTGSGIPAVVVGPPATPAPGGAPLIDIQVAHTPGHTGTANAKPDVQIGPPADLAALEAALSDPSVARPGRSIVVSDKAAAQDGGKKKDSTALFGP